MSAEDRIKLFFEKGNYTEINPDKISDDPLKFTDKKKYKERLKEYRKKTNRDDAFIIIKGANIMQSTAITKLLNFSSNFAAFIIFAFQGYVIWYLGLTMAVAQIAGAYTGSKFAIKNGEKVVRPVLVIVSILLSLRILLG